MRRAGVPEACQAERSKPEIALAELKRALEAGVRFRAVVADAGYGISAAFRRALSALGLLWAVGIPRIQKVYPVDVQLVPAPPTRGRPRKTLIPDMEAVAAEKMVAARPWRWLTWRQGTKGPLRAQFAALRVRVADGPEVRLQGRTGQHLPDAEVWLVGERRASGEQKHYLSNLPPDTTLKQLASTIKARWVCEQAHQQLKEELGLDHFEGRSWRGLHRHALMSLIAFCFLQHQRLAAVRRGKKAQGTPAAPEPSGHPTGASRSPGPNRAPTMSLLPSPLQPAAAEQSAKVVLSSSSMVGQQMAVSFGIKLDDSLVNGAVEVIRAGEGLMSEVMPLQVAPDPFNIVQLRGVFRQPLDREPVGARREGSAACLTRVDRAVVEDKHDGLEHYPELGTIAPINLLQQSNEVRASFGPAGAHDELATSPIEHAEHRYFGALARGRNAQVGPLLGPDVRQIRMGERFGLVREQKHDVARLSLGREQLSA